MRSKGRSAGAALAALAVSLPAAHARSGAGARDASAADPGITGAQIVLGATAPLSGPGSADSAVVKGADAYFRFVNARGGVNGRTIRYVYLDDASDPAQALAATRRLVERDRVFAIVNSFGTEQGLAARAFLNGARVPQLFVASGATTLGRDAVRQPWTIGFRPSHRAEGWIYGRYLARARPGARVAVLSDGGDAGRDLLAGLAQGIARSSVRVVATEVADLARLRASGADVLALFVPAPDAVEASAEARRLGWRPLVFTSAAAALPNAVSLTFLKDPGDPRWARDPGIRLYRTILARHAPGAKAQDSRYLYGMAVAYTTVEALKRPGRNLTRVALLAAVRTLNSVSNPFLLPGIAVRTGRGDGFPLEQGRLQRFSRGSWRPFGGLWSSGA